MKIQKWLRVQKMERYLQKKYYSGSIIERANYQRNKVKPSFTYGSLIERELNKKTRHGLWQKLRRIILR